MGALAFLNPLLQLHDLFVVVDVLLLKCLSEFADLFFIDFLHSNEAIFLLLCVFKLFLQAFDLLQQQVVLLHDQVSLILQLT